VLQLDFGDWLPADERENMVGQCAPEAGWGLANQLCGLEVQPLLGDVLEGAHLIEQLRLDLVSFGFQGCDHIGDIVACSQGTFTSILEADFRVGANGEAVLFAVEPVLQSPVLGDGFPTGTSPSVYLPGSVKDRTKASLSFRLKEGALSGGIMWGHHFQNDRDLPPMPPQPLEVSGM